MGKKRPERTARRVDERARRQLVRDRERLFLLELGGSRLRPIDVESAAVIELRARATPCPQCAGTLNLEEHAAESSTLRRVDLRCVQCGVPRQIFFRVALGPS